MQGKTHRSPSPSLVTFLKDRVLVLLHEHMKGQPWKSEYCVQIGLLRPPVKSSTLENRQNPKKRTQHVLFVEHTCAFPSLLCCISSLCFSFSPKVPRRLAARGAVGSSSSSWAHPWSCLQGPSLCLTFPFPKKQFRLCSLLLLWLCLFSLKPFLCFTVLRFNVQTLQIPWLCVVQLCCRKWRIYTHETFPGQTPFGSNPFSMTE